MWCGDFVKSRKRVPAREPRGEEAGPAAEEPDHVLARVQERGRMAEMLRKLPLEFREAVVMRYYMELSFAEIAQIAGISLSLAKMRVYRGLERLREFMGGVDMNGGDANDA